MLLTVVVFYLTYIQVSYTLPPNIYRNNADNLQTRYNERFIQHSNLEEQNVYAKGSHNYHPLPNIGSHSNFNIAQSNAAVASGKLEIINENGMANNGRLKQRNEFRPKVNQYINVPQNYESILNNLNNQRMISQFQGENLAKQYGLPQNFKINLRGYVAPDINKGFIPPQSAPLKPFPQIRPVQNTIQPTGVNIGNNVNRPMLNQPVASLPSKVNSENARLQSKKSYTIVHPNGTIEETDDFEYIKKNYPYYTVHDLNKKNIKKDSIADMKVHAGSPLVNPTIVPIYNLPLEQPLLNFNKKETLVPNTLVQITQSQINLTKIDESAIVNATHANANKETSSFRPISPRNLTSQHDISKPGSQKLYTSFLETLQSIKSNDSKHLPVIDKTSPNLEIIKPPKKSQDTKIESGSLLQDNVNDMLEKISAIDFWKEIDVIQITDETAAGEINKENLFKNFETIDSNEDEELTKNSTLNPETIPSKDLTFEDNDVITDTNDTYDVFNTNPEVVEDFVSSIEDRLEFIKPFLIINETDAIDKQEENSHEPGNSLSTNTNASGQALTNPIYIPHISLVKGDDTNSSFWFTTNDKKALEKLSPQKRKNVTIPSTLTNGENKTGTMYSNESKENTTFEEKKPVDSKEEIKNS
ncbi:uncharacterized protein LOC111002484 [Pieris rapae]|uniref:uncharacterized protein LOC111002484 n=1 Tax=Pieris rapae TaxID=64459 RepID=UPI001E280D7B|nr:uncharacterized protein LOC111002484 [Pieris rapae]